MPEINPLPPFTPAIQVRPAALRAYRQQADPAAEPAQGDRAQFSEHARMLARLAELPKVREHVVDRVRAQIAEGTYESPEKLDAAVHALIQELESDPDLAG